MRIELMTSSLPRKCSTPELQRQHCLLNHSTKEVHTPPFRREWLQIRLSGRRDSNPPPTAWKAVALPDELLPHVSFCYFSTRSVTQKTVGREGFEPPKASPTDLQSAPFNHSGISPDLHHFLSRWTDSNRRPADYKSAALAN